MTMNAEPMRIPQPKPWPVIGNILDIDGKTGIQSLMRLADEHGPIFRLELLGRNVLIVGGHDLVDELCDETRFAKKNHRALDNIREVVGDGLFTAYDGEPNWGIAHRLLTPAFGPLSVRGMVDRMQDVAEQMLLRWERFGDAPIDVTDQVTRLTLDTIALCAFDFRFNSFYQTDMHPFVAAMLAGLEEAWRRTRRPEIATKLMVWRRRRFEADTRLMFGLADELVARRRAENGPPRGDLLDKMLAGRDPVTGKGLCDENIRYQMVTFLAAGHETTSGLLSFALYFLMTNPAALAAAREEVDRVMGDAAPRGEDLAELRYVEQALMETLRLWPTAPAFGLRARADTTLGGGWPVASTDTILVLLPTLHRDPSVWPDPEAFRPERFAPAAIAARPANAWKPFGNGQRACIGRGFAMQEAVLALAMILQRFEIEAADPDYRLAVAETLTLKPAGFFIRARRRQPPARRRPPAAPRKEASPGTARACPVAPVGDGTPLLVIYGSNFGSSEAFARRIAAEAETNGYAARVGPMDDHFGRLPTEGGLIVVTASYQGKPPDNAGAFVAWADGLAPGALAGVRYAVLGCGDRKWARTFQAIPIRVDAALAAAGATRLRPRGEIDADRDFVTAFETWYEGLWRELDAGLAPAFEYEATLPIDAATEIVGRSSRCQVT